MSAQRFLLTTLLILALLASGASASPAEPAASPAAPAPASAPVAPGDEYWATGYHLPGMDGSVNALAVGPDGSLYAGGEFDYVDGVSAQRIARWDGSEWHPLGSGLGGSVFPAVHALAFGPDDSLYAGGNFGVARWDGVTSSWHPLGSEMNGMARSTPGATSPQLAGSQPTASPAGTVRLRRGIPWAAE